jgi:hypothetical protein
MKIKEKHRITSDAFLLYDVSISLDENEWLLYRD